VKSDIAKLASSLSHSSVCRLSKFEMREDSSCHHGSDDHEEKSCSGISVWVHTLLVFQYGLLKVEVEDCAAMRLRPLTQSVTSEGKSLVVSSALPEVIRVTGLYHVELEGGIHL
jgi:hypothetical protein